MEKRRVVIICLLLAGLFLYLVASQFADLIFDVLNIAVNRDYGMTIPELIGAGVSVLAFLFVIKSAKSMGFFTDVVAELGKVVHPTPKESSLSAVWVMFMVGLAAVFLAFYDLIWTNFTRFVLAVGSGNV